MFEGLQRKWKVGGLQLTFILLTFAIGGSVTGYAARKLMPLLNIDQKWLWIFIYILLITLIWPIAVIIISVFFGQFKFFAGYLKKIGKRMGLVNSRKFSAGSQQSASPLTIHHSPVSITIFASGAGSNAQKIIDHFRNSSAVKIALIVCNKPGAGVLDIAKREKIPALLIEKEKFFRGNAYVDELRNHDTGFLVLAGFLWKIPARLLQAYHGRIINIHPALLPGYGGKGMYGNHVHEAVIAAGEKESGITIHYVDDEYDHGDTIFQARCPVFENDTAHSLAERIHKLEHEHYPKVIEKVVMGMKK